MTPTRNVKRRRRPRVWPSPLCSSAAYFEKVAATLGENHSRLSFFFFLKLGKKKNTRYSSLELAEGSRNATAR